MARLLLFFLLNIFFVQGKKFHSGSNRLHVIDDRQNIPYELFLPLKLSKKENAPIIVFLHGRGESGSFTVTNAQSLPLQLIRNSTFSSEFSFIAIIPQCPPECATLNVWTEDALKSTTSIVSEVIQRYNGDPTRVYLAGQSMGGNGAWIYAAQQLNMFAAVLVVCGYGGTHEDSHLITSSLAHTKTSIAVVHAADDSVIPVSASDIMVRYLQQAGVDVRYDRYEHAPGPPMPEYAMLIGHGSYEIAFRDSTIYSWFLNHSCKDCGPSLTSWMSFSQRFHRKHAVPNSKTNVGMEM